MANNEAVIGIGRSKYYLSTILGKHLHAGTDVDIYTREGEKLTIKKGEWIGKLFGYEQNVFGAPAFKFQTKDAHFKNREFYYLRYYGVDTFDDKILRYNYTMNKWVLRAGTLISLLIFPPATDIFYNRAQPENTLPTQKQSDEKTENPLDNMFSNMFGGIKKTVFLGAAALAAYRALTSEKQAEQFIFGGIAAYAAYEGMKDTTKK
jgi:hypothetical protein